MGGPYKRRKYHHGDTHLKKGWRTKRRTKDLDEIDEDLGAGKVEKLLAQDVDFDKPGLAQFYCVHCAKHFIDGDAFKTHVKGKPHKRRLHALKTEPYTVEESLRASGMGSYTKPGKRKMETLVPEAVAKGESLADVKKRAKMDTGDDETSATAAETVEGTTTANNSEADNCKKTASSLTEDADGDVKM